MPLPPRRVFACAIAVSGRPVEDRLDAATHATGRRRYFLPNWEKDVLDVGGLDIGDGQVPNLREGKARERAAPLLRAAAIPPLVFVKVEVALGCLGEGNACGLGSVGSVQLGSFVVYRVDAPEQQHACV